MYVNVTPALFDAISKAMLRWDTTRDPADADTIIGLLSLACLDNGGDFNPELVRRRTGAEVKLVVVHA